MSGEFKKCPEGHVYDSKLEECPYCNGEDLEDELDKLPPDDEREPPETAMCYDMGLSRFHEPDDEW
ncbi:MAG: hypothetical protein FWB83_03145 [Treponema sp.]|nr:hypothetical protein [Treponema sp.]